MEFFQSRQAKLLLIVFIVLGAMVFGVLKQLEGSGVKLAGNKTTKQETRNPDAQANPDAQQTPDMMPKETMGGSAENIPVDTDGTSTGKAFELANSAMLQGKIYGASKLYEVSAKSEDAEIKKTSLEKLADCYSQLNNTDGLIDTYEKLLEMETDKNVKKEIYEKLGLQYNEKGSFDKAVEMYKTSYEMEPTASAAVQLCEIYDKIHDTEGMQRVIDDFSAKNPGYRQIFSKYDQFRQETPAPAPAPQEPENKGPMPGEFMPPEENQ